MLYLQVAEPFYFLEMAGIFKMCHYFLFSGRLRIIQPIQDCPSVAEDQPDECNNVPNPPSCSDQPDLRQKDAPSHFPDGLFRAEPVDVCSSDEREEEDLRTTNKLCHIGVKSHTLIYEVPQKFTKF